MSKDDKSAQDRSIKIGRDATGSETPSGPQGGDVPKVFISSTSEDLKVYREAARDAAIAAGVLPIQMEYFVASGQHAPLEACLQKVAEADVVALIVAHRYGWVPDDQEGDEHKSITWLECEQARADNKEVLAFLVDDAFSWPAELKEDYRIAAAVSKRAATPEFLAEVQRNVERLADFRKWVDSIGVRAKFTTEKDLGWKVSEALREWKQRHAKPATQSSPKKRATAKPTPVFPPLYREWLQRQCADIELLGIGVEQGRAVKLNHVYVPLTTNVAEEDSPEKGKKRERAVKAERLLAEGREKPQLLLEQLERHSLYVPGDPGTGKSTFCRWVAWLVATGSLPTAEVAAPEGYAEAFPQSLVQRLPLLIRLRDVWKYLPKDAGRDSLSQAELESSLSNWLETSSPGGLDWSDVTSHLEHGSALMIFDGVDEVPLREGEGRGACYPRATLLAGLIDAAAGWQKQGNRVLITSRPYGIDDQQARKLPLRQAPIRELDDTLQSLLVRRWFHILKDHGDEAAETAADMLRHLGERPELGELTANPMLLTAMCVIYDEGKRLPQDKHDLYLRIVNNVLHNRYRNDPSELEMAREQLSVVAYGMHTGAGLGEERTTPQAETSYKEIERMVQAYHDDSAGTFSGYKNALETRDELLQRSGLLLARGDDKAGFYHFTFQDFLAARRLADIDRDRLFETFSERAGTAEWRSTLSFLFSSELANSREQARRLLMKSSQHSESILAMPAHKWTFKSRFRANAYGWNGTALATKRLKEAVTEIKKVAKSDPVTAADGAVGLMERIWPALQGIDSSSGSLGNAVNRTLETLIPFVTDAPADKKIRSKWLDRLYEAVQEDGVDYLSPVGDQWGAICGDVDLANEWADRLLPLLSESWANEKVWGWVKGGSLCLSCLVAAERYEDLQLLMSLRSYRFWPFDKFWARALVQQRKINEAIQFAESCRKAHPSYDDRSVVEFCEQSLLDAGRVDEAYERYALQAARATTNLATFRQVAKKYPDRERREILLALMAAHGPKGKWFAAAKGAGCLDEALQCAADGWADPATLMRAARDFAEKDANFAAEVALCAIKNLLAGGGYEPTTLDMVNAHRHLRDAAARCGRLKWAETEVDQFIERGTNSDRQEFLRVLISEHGRRL